MRTRDERTRTDLLVEWVGWHLVELVAVGVPLLLVLLVSPWFAPLAVLTAGAWAVHEARLRRRKRQRSITAATTPAVEPEDVEPGADREGATA